MQPRATEPAQGHPSAFELEAYRGGVASEEIASHLGGCEECSRYLQALKAEREAFAEDETWDAFSRRPAISAAFAQAAAEERPARPAGKRVWWVPLAALVVGGGLAALMFVALPTAPVDNRSEAERAAGDVVRLKGEGRVGVVLAREGQQTRHQGSVSVRPGDALRIEVTLVEAARDLVVGVLEEDGTWTPLRQGLQLAAGSHIIGDDALHVDADRTEGWVLAGSADAVDAARRTRTFDAVMSCRILWDAEGD